MENNQPQFSVELDEEIEELETEERTEVQPAKKEKKKGKLHWLTKLMIFVDLCAALCFILFYSPLGISDEFRNWFVSTAIGTGKHKYLAYIFYDETRIKTIAAQNVTIQPSGVTDVSQIEMVDYSDVTTFANIYDEQILTKDPGNDDYKLITLKENGYTGFILVVYHPEKLDVCMASRKYGDYISTISKRNKALFAVNAAPFYFDPESHYMVPTTDIVAGGKPMVSTGTARETVGMNEDGVLVLMKGTGQDAINAGLKWAIQFYPFLIVNGEVAKFSGNGGLGGYEPRTAIGQRKDGIVLFVVIDGRGFGGSRGAKLEDLADIFTRYGCYNAANLDGGGSSTLVINNKVINHPCEGMQEQERYNVCGLCYIPDEE